jgi:hypothetical protein
MDVAALRLRLANSLGESNLDYWSAAERLQYLNDAYIDINTMVRPLTDYVSDLTGLGAVPFMLPADFMELIEDTISWRKTGTVEEISLRRAGIPELNKLYNDDWKVNPLMLDPAYYYFDNTDGFNPFLMLAPGPVAVGTLAFQYRVTVAPMVLETDTPWGNKLAEHHMAIVYGAEVYARQKEQNEQAEARAKQRYQEAVGQMRVSLIYRPGEQEFTRLQTSPYRRGR